MKVTIYNLESIASSPIVIKTGNGTSILLSMQQILREAYDHSCRNNSFGNDVWRGISRKDFF